MSDYTNNESGDRVDLLAGLRTGDWLQAQHFPALQWVVPGIIPEGFALLVGPPKVGKSWLSLSIALAVAEGGRVLGAVTVEPRPVLLIALEDGDRRLQDRCHQLGVDPIPGRFNYLTRIVPGAAVQTIQAWLDTLPLIGPAPLIILDTLGKIMPPTMPGEGAYARDYRVAGALKRICDDWPGMSLVALHHDRKAQTDDFVESVSGTNGIAGAADTILLISRPRNEDEGLFKVTGRDVLEQEYAVRSENGRWSLIGHSLTEAAQQASTLRSTANLGDQSAEIVRYIADHPEGVRPTDLATHLGLEPTKVRVYLGRLVDAGKITNPSRGIYRPVTSVTSVTFPRTDPLKVTEVTEVTGGSKGSFPADWLLFAGTTTCRECGNDLVADAGTTSRCRDHHRTVIA